MSPQELTPQTTEVPGRARQWKPILGSAGGIFLGAVFLVAAWGKAMSPGAFVEQIRLEGLDFILSAGLLALLTLAVETGLGLALLLGIRRLWLLVPTTLLVSFFVLLNGRNYYLVWAGLRDETAACGCFGELLERTPAQAFWQDLLLLVPPLLLALWGRAIGFRPFPKVRLILSMVAAIGMVVFAWRSPELQYASLAAQIAAGAEEETFLKSDDYLLMVDGREVPEAEIYDRQDPVAFLILAPQLSSPLLVRPQEGGVHSIGTESILKRKDGQVELVLDPDYPPPVTFEVIEDAVTFTIEGREVQMKNKAHR